MFSHTIAFVPGKSILRELCVEGDHGAVAGDLRDDAGCCDAQAQPVTADQRRVIHRQTPDGQSVHQRMVRTLRQGIHRARHGEMRGAQNIHRVDFSRRCLADGPDDIRRAGDDRKKFFPARRRHFFRIRESVERKAIGEDDGCRNNRTGKRAAPGLVNARHQRKPAGAQCTLAGEIAGHGKAVGED